MYFKEFLNKTATFVIVVCILALLVGFVIMCCSAHKSDRLPSIIRIEVATDTTNTVLVHAISNSVVDSLNSEMQKREQLLADKYQNILEQKERNEEIFSFGSILVGIVVSILGFWGFKSFEEIKEKAKNVAKETAKAEITPGAIKEVIKGHIVGEIADRVAQRVKEEVYNDLMNLKEASDQLNSEMKELRNIHGKLRNDVDYLLDKEKSIKVDTELPRTQKESATDDKPANNLDMSEDFDNDPKKNPFEDV